MERQQADTLIRTKLRPPFTRSKLVPRPRLRERVVQGLRGPLTLITAPAGFGKTTLVASCVTAGDRPAAWLSLDKDDNQEERFLTYLVTALQEADSAIGSEASRLVAASQPAPSEAVLTSLINDLDAAAGEMVLVLDDYQFVRSQAVHAQVTFLLEHCPSALHLLIATRSDPPLPLARLRARGQMVELRAADLRFTEPEAAQFLSDVMGFPLDAGSVAVLEERTEGWIAGLQMAALSMRHRRDVPGFIERFSGTNRYILDYLLEEVLAKQSPEIQRFLLHTSILERLIAPLCDAVLADDAAAKSQGPDRSTRPESLFGQSASALAYLERANLFLVPLDDERIWYRYHHLFADLLRAQLQRSLGAQGVAGLHVRAADWHAQHGSVLEAIHHASAASDDERVERLIEQHYREMVIRGEMSGYRFWTGRLSKEVVHRRPWLCIYEAYSHSWFGELDKADRLLEQAEQRVPSEVAAPDVRAMQAHLAYIKSRVTAMRGDLDRAIELCLQAREYAPAGNLALHLDTRVTLGYEYLMVGDDANASQILNEAIQSGTAAGALIYSVAASCFMARLSAVRGLLHRSYDTYQTAAQWIPEASGDHRDATALVEAGMADVLCEWNDLDAALAHVRQALALLPHWGKADDLILAYVTLARIHLAQANRNDAAEAIENAVRLVQTRGVFPEARYAAERAQVKLWLAQGDTQSASRWAASQEDRFHSEDELAHITLARVRIAQNRPREALALLLRLEGAARPAGRMGRVIEILLLKALAMRELGDFDHAAVALAECLALAEAEGYVRAFLDEGQPMQMLLAQWLAHARAGPLRDHALRLLLQFDAEPQVLAAPQEMASTTSDPSASHVEPSGQALVEPLSQREREVLYLLALGRTNKEIAQQLVVATGTVKAHTSHLYRKLDVANRTEAVARARQLGILP
jgi:LuxR family maltose regulon positive regulatory protein